MTALEEKTTSYEFVNNGPFANLYKKDNEILKVYPFSDDVYQNERNILSCDIAVILSENVPEYVPKVFEKRVNEKDVFIVMERIQGINLSDFLLKKKVIDKTIIEQKSPSPLTGKEIPSSVGEEEEITPTVKSTFKWVYNTLNVLKVVISLVKGLLAIHEAGYGHFDLHSNNIIIQEDYTVKIIDFDMSDDIGSLDAGDGVTPEKEMDYYQLKAHVAELIFSRSFTNYNLCQILKITRSYTVKDVIDYKENPEFALKLFEIYKSLGTSVYELEDQCEASDIGTCSDFGKEVITVM